MPRAMQRRTGLHAAWSWLKALVKVLPPGPGSLPGLPHCEVAPWTRRRPHIARWRIMSCQGWECGGVWLPSFPFSLSPTDLSLSFDHHAASRRLMVAWAWGGKEWDFQVDSISLPALPVNKGLGGHQTSSCYSRPPAGHLRGLKLEKSSIQVLHG